MGSPPMGSPPAESLAIESQIEAEKEAVLLEKPLLPVEKAGEKPLDVAETEDANQPANMPKGKSSLKPRQNYLLCGRQETLRGTLRCLQALQPGPCQIVETGTLRDEREGASQSDGWSTLAWGAQAAKCEGKVWTVDVDAAALATCRRLTEAYAPFISYVCRDSIAFLQNWKRLENGPIHLLYLDSLDYGDNHEARVRSEAHQLAEAQAALPHLHEICLVLLDDTSPAPRARREVGCQEGKWESKWESKWEGKGAQSIPYLLQQGFALVWEPYEHWSHGGQVLLVRGAPVEQLQEIIGAQDMGDDVLDIGVLDDGADAAIGISGKGACKPS